MVADFAIPNTDPQESLDAPTRTGQSRGNQVTLSCSSCESWAYAYINTPSDFDDPMTVDLDAPSVAVFCRSRYHSTCKDLVSELLVLS
jgi:hypothetical protein